MYLALLSEVSLRRMLSQQKHPLRMTKRKKGTFRTVASLAPERTL